MKKIIRALSYTILFLTGCINFGCHNDDIPDHQRIWWYEKLESDDEISSFMAELKDTGKNGDFNFGLSKFEISDYFGLFNIVFSGHIKNDCSKKEDVYNSTYDKFWISTIYLESDQNLSVYLAKIKLYFYPFFLEGEQFDKEKIECVPAKCTSGEYEASFNYQDERIMKVELTRQSNPLIDKEKMISELISNYELIV